MAYAIIRTGGKQFRVEAGKQVRVPSIDKPAGEAVELDVLLIGGDGETKVGSSLDEGARVAATVVEHGRGEKLIVFKFRRRKRYRRKAGHRQSFTAVRITSVKG
jgi:large subunit ribosomal protein L21